MDSSKIITGKELWRIEENVGRLDFLAVVTCLILASAVTAVPAKSTKSSPRITGVFIDDGDTGPRASTDQRVTRAILELQVLKVTRAILVTLEPTAQKVILVTKAMSDHRVRHCPMYRGQFFGSGTKNHYTDPDWVLESTSGSNLTLRTTTRNFTNLSNSVLYGYSGFRFDPVNLSVQLQWW